jgi:hypothetical protein
MLSDFFRINLPYCFEKVEGDKWRCLNREYLPLGFNNRDDFYTKFPDLPISTSYSKLTEKFLLSIVDESFVQRNSEGHIEKIFLYNDGSSPMNSKDKSAWNDYFDKLKKLSKLEVK